MALRLFLFLFGLSIAAGNDCPVYQPAVTCASSVLVVLDYSSGLEAGLQQHETNVFQQQVLPHLNSNGGQKVGITYTGGNGYPMPSSFSSSYDGLCAQLDAVRKVTSRGNTANLVDLFQTIYTKYGDTIDHLIVYTTETTPNKIQYAGAYATQYLPNMKISVLSFFGYSSQWNGFPATGVIIVNPYDLSNQRISDCLVGQSCGSTDKCSIGNFLPPATPSPPPATPSPAVVEQTCSACVASKVSADVSIMIDNSAFTGEDGLQKIENYIKGTFSQFNVQQTGSNDPFHVRVGIRYYSDTVYEYKAFGTVTANDLANIKIPFNNVNQTDMVDALWAATDNDFYASSRPNAPKVIVVFATNFVGTGNSRFPVNDFQYFIAQGYKVIVYELDKPGTNAYILKQLTNPAYFINSGDSNAANSMIEAMCTASCVCPKDTAPYFVDPNTAQPTAGCYLFNSETSNYSTASAKCAQRGGYVAEAQTADKSQFLTGNNIYMGQPVYQGLTWNTSMSRWVWANGKPLVSGYAPWAGSSAHTTNIDCVTVQGGQWRQTDCRNGYNYVCQLPPCDQKNAC